jgi:hypothetical protein
LCFAHFSARSLSVSLKPGMCFDTVVEVIICHSVLFADVEDNT